MFRPIPIFAHNQLTPCLKHLLTRREDVFVEPFSRIIYCDQSKYPNSPKQTEIREALRENVPGIEIVQGRPDFATLLSNLDLGETQLPSLLILEDILTKGSIGLDSEVKACF